MPAGRTYWVAVFRVPADNYEHEHVCRLNSVGESKAKALEVLKVNTNVDVRVEKLYRMEDHRQLEDETARAIREGGPRYRSLVDSEQFLTAPQAMEIRKREGLTTSNIVLPNTPTTPEGKIERAVSEANSEIMNSGLVVPQ